jgi:hypothetical protein
VAAEHNFKRQAGQPKDHFENLLEATYPNHSYPTKHKLKDYTMMKNFLTSGSLSKGRKPEGDQSMKDTAPIPEEVAVMTVFSWSYPSTREAMGLANCWVPKSL